MSNETAPIYTEVSPQHRAAVDEARKRERRGLRVIMERAIETYIRLEHPELAPTLLPEPQE